MGVCNCSMFCHMLLYVHFSIAIILMGKRELVALLNLSSWCLVVVEWLSLAVPRGCLHFVIVVFPDHNHLLILYLSVANVNPALTLHVNNIKMCFLKIERMLIYTPYVADASEIYSVRPLKSVLRLMDC